jgi:glycosyltransferase involved in cell wall biosynthesis
MKISVVIAAYNASATIERAVRSVLAQSRRADEILVVDDGSTDGTADVVRRFGSAVRLISQANGGASVARNTGIQNASGDWIAFLDADDEWLGEKLHLQEKMFCRHPDLAWGCTNFILTDNRGRVQKPAFAETCDSEAIFDYLAVYCHGIYAWTSTLMVRRDVFDKTGLFVPGMRRAQDTDLWFRIAYQFSQIGYLPGPLAIYYRNTPGSITTSVRDTAFMFHLVERHLDLSKQQSRQDAFLPCARQMLEVWIRELIREGRGREAGELMRHFQLYLPPRFCREIRFRLMSPAAGAAADVFLKLKNYFKQHE